jgi:carboxyl-terminal processing protease
LNNNLSDSESKEVGDLGAVKLTIQKFYRITGGSTQYKGVVPDIVLPSLFRHLKSGEKYLDYSLPWDQIDPVKYTSFNPQPFDLEMIRKRSLQRIEHDPGLQAIAKEAKMADERSKQTAVSLKLADMRQRMEEIREEREKLSAQFRNYQTGFSDDNQSEVETNDAKNTNAPDWKEQIKQDPYIGEAKDIILDMKR